MNQVYLVLLKQFRVKANMTLILFIFGGQSYNYPQWSLYFSFEVLQIRNPEIWPGFSIVIQMKPTQSAIFGLSCRNLLVY
jgi:hypothetical protein